MISTQILAVGKIKDSWLREGCGEYQKRIGQWSRLQVTELEECRLPDAPSPAQIRACIQQEGERMLQKLPRGARVIAMCIEGRALSSPELAGYLAQAGVQGADTAVFCIGGSYGLSQEVKQRAALQLSMSPMTFPHQLARLLLLEQIYRAFTINANHKYHK